MHRLQGYWPVGTAAVVVAEDCYTAVEALTRELAERGLPQEGDLQPSDMQEINTESPGITILSDGNY